MIAVLAPGQGSQEPGMLIPWLDAPAAHGRLAAWSEATGLDLERLGTVGGADEIRDTAVTQPLVVATSLLAAGLLADRVVRRGDWPVAGAVAGHSVGELTAATLAGVLTADAAVRLAAARGRAMADACALAPPTGMSAVLGGRPEQVLDRLRELGLEPANRNGAGQVVAAGPLDALARLAADPPERSRVIPLPVAGAFHTRYMAPAERALRTAAATITPADPVGPLLSNADGAVLTDGAEVLRRLVAQVIRPVRWDACLGTLRGLGVRAVIELAPAGTLVGLARREFSGVATVALRTPADLGRAAELLDSRAGSPA